MNGNSLYIQRFQCSLPLSFELSQGFMDSEVSLSSPHYLHLIIFTSLSSPPPLTIKIIGQGIVSTGVD